LGSSENERPSKTSLIEPRNSRNFRITGRMRIASRHRDSSMTQKLLHRDQIDPCLHKSRSKGVAQNSTEQRLARVLLQLAKLGTKDGQIPKISQEVLANMVGTSRSRTNLFVKGFRKRGFVEYNSRGIRVHSSLRAVCD
jgi:CRP-like cAMP-binding protein